MMKILYIVGGFLLLLFLIDAVNKAKTRRARESGLLPPPGQGSDSDVERMAAQDQKIQAIKLYREIHGVGLKEAKEAVEVLIGKSKLPGT